jgi:ribosomal protein S18 acetylase RimI-like enzyme
MADLGLLDNPIWNALVTEHAGFARGADLARSYRPDIGPLSGLSLPSCSAYEALGDLERGTGPLVLFLEEEVALPAGWSLVRRARLSQMVAGSKAIPSLEPEAGMRRLMRDDVPAMIDLAHLTEPGPFRSATIDLGSFFGIFASDRLLAMAGERMRMPGLIEVSAVCTHPDARGRGYAQALIAAVMRDIADTASIPFLHVLSDNLRAIAVYQALGFTERRMLYLAVLRKDLA